MDIGNDCFINRLGNRCITTSNQAPKDKKAVNTAVGRAEDICSKFHCANDQRGLGSWPLHSLHIQGPGDIFGQCIFVIYISISILYIYIRIVHFLDIHCICYQSISNIKAKDYICITSVSILLHWQYHKLDCHILWYVKHSPKVHTKAVLKVS